MIQRTELACILLVQALIVLIITHGPLPPSKAHIKENLNKLMSRQNINSAY